MIDPKAFVESLAGAGVTNFYGVPDSLLKDFCAYVSDHGTPHQHVITANEGNAAALACGYHMATGKAAAVYLQNSGLGNAINPLTSIADSDVYRIPMVLIIGWRGEPGVHDEPQHLKQGRITKEQLEILEVPYAVVSAHSQPNDIAHWLTTALAQAQAPVALLVQKDAFSTYKKLGGGSENKAKLSREEALSQLLDLSGERAVVSTTGKTSREVFELRSQRSESQRDFLTVGGMGHTSSIALGVALGAPEKKVVCIDGDGSLLMHMGALPIIGSLKPKNFLHVLLNNAAHESVGGQPTVGDFVNFESVALACGYVGFYKAETLQEISDGWAALEKLEGPAMLEVKISVGSRANLGRPTSSPVDNKDAFMSWVRS